MSIECIGNNDVVEIRRRPVVFVIAGTCSAHDPRRISTHTYVNPVIAVLLGWLNAGEELTVEMLIASMFIVISVALVLNNQRTLVSRASR